jgi:hypothetical protein
VRVSKEMIDENQIGQVNDQMLQLRNTFVRANDRAVKALLQSAVVPTTAVPKAWTDTTSNPRVDIALAMAAIESARPPHSRTRASDRPMSTTDSCRTPS